MSRVMTKIIQRIKVQSTYDLLVDKIGTEYCDGMIYDLTESSGTNKFILRGDDERSSTHHCATPNFDL